MTSDVYTSLLWPNKDVDFFSIDAKTMEDLDLTHIFEQHEEVMSDWLKDKICQLPKSEQVVKFRQAILRDFDTNSRLLESFVKVASEFYETRNMIKFAFERDHTLYNVLKRIEDSEVILKGLYEIRLALKEASLSSEGLMSFKEMLNQLMHSELFVAYEKDLKSIRNKSTIRSMKLGLNLDQDMNPKEAIVLTLEEELFKYTRSMKRVARVIGYGINEIKKIPRRIFAPETVIPQEDLNALEKVITPAMGQLLKFIDTFNDALLEVFEPMKDELSYYTFGCHIKNTLVSMGYKTSQLSFSDDGDYAIHQLYNINLAYHFQTNPGTMVYNDLLWKRNNMYILTGANRGGKTTFTQAIGQIHWLGLLGYFVPASSAKLPIIDGMFVHFPIEEKETVLYGRLGEECQRFSEFYGQMTKSSLLLMNESFSGTSHGESLQIAKEALRAIAKIGVGGLYNTHLHELASDIESLKMLTDGEGYDFRNLVSGSQDSPQSFVIKEGVPLGKSYAHEIAVKYGISYEQLMG